MVVPPIWGWGWFWVSTWTWTCWTSSWVHGVVGGVGCFCLCCGERNWCMYGCSRVTRVRWWSPRLSEDPIPLCWLCAKIAMFTAPPSVQYQIAQFFRINNQRRVGSRDKSCLMLANALVKGTRSRALSKQSLIHCCLLKQSQRYKLLSLGAKFGLGLRASIVVAFQLLGCGTQFFHGNPQFLAVSRYTYGLASCHL